MCVHILCINPPGIKTLLYCLRPVTLGDNVTQSCVLLLRKPKIMIQKDLYDSLQNTLENVTSSRNNVCVVCVQCCICSCVCACGLKWLDGPVLSVSHKTRVKCTLRRAACLTHIYSTSNKTANLSHSHCDLYLPNMKCILFILLRLAICPLYISAKLTKGL